MANYKLDFTGEEVNELLHKINKGTVGVSSWNDLEDKPFGETTVTGDTLTWGGNIDTFVDASGGEGIGFVKLSDTVLTLDDLANGGIAVNSMGTFEFTHYIDGTEMLGVPCLVAANDSWEDGDVMMMCPLIFTTDVDMAGAPIPKGILAYCIPGQVEPVSWTVNGYTFTETKVKTIEGKFLEPFEVKKGTDTIIWNSADTGLEEYDLDGMVLLKLSDAPTAEDLEKGVTIKATTNNGDTFTTEVSSVEIANGGTRILYKVSESSEEAVVVAVDDVFYYEGVAPIPKGVWKLEEGKTTDLVITLNDGEIGGSTKLKPEYMPDANIVFTIDSAAPGNTNSAVVTCNKPLSTMMDMSLEDLQDAKVVWTVGGTPAYIIRPISVMAANASDGDKVLAVFLEMADLASLDVYVVAIAESGNGVEQLAK